MSDQKDVWDESTHGKVPEGQESNYTVVNPAGGGVAPQDDSIVSMHTSKRPAGGEQRPESSGQGNAPAQGDGEQPAGTGSGA
jgi:hypothetical protein